MWQVWVGGGRGRCVGVCREVLGAINPSDLLDLVPQLVSAESFPVTVCASGHSTSPPLGQFTFQIFCNELQFVSMSGKMVSHWAVENLNPVAMETDGESGVPQIILSGSSHG